MNNALILYPEKPETGIKKAIGKLLEHWKEVEEIEFKMPAVFLRACCFWIYGRFKFE